MIPWFDASFSVGPLHLHAFGLLAAVGLVLSVNLMRLRGTALKLDDDQVFKMIGTMTITAIVVAHLYDVFAYPTAEPLSLALIVNPTRGLSSFGGFLGATIGAVVWCRLNHEPLMPYADACAYGFPGGWFLARLGCFSIHDHPGAETTFFLGVQYPWGTRHDLGLYEALWALAIFFVFEWMSVKDKQPRPVGAYLSVLLLTYAPTRFLLDFLRATDTTGADPRYLGLTGAQYLCFVLFAIGLFVARWTVRANQKRSTAWAAKAR